MAAYYELDPPTTTLPSSSPEQSQIQVRTKIQFSLWHTFKHHIPRFILTIIIDIILPLVIYIFLQKYIKPVYALLAASTPPLSMVITKAIWLRTFDALGFLIFITFVASAIVAVVTHSAIILLLEKSLVTAMMSIFFALTLMPFQYCFRQCRIRPLAYYFYQDLVPTRRIDLGLPENLFGEEQEQIHIQYAKLHNDDDIKLKLSTKQEVAQVYEWLYFHCLPFRFSCYLLTSIWSMGFFLEFLARLLLILARLPINLIVIYGHIMLSSVTAIMVLLSVICVTVERKYTLAFIEQWRVQNLNLNQQQQRQSEMNSSFVNVHPHSDIVLRINT